MSTAESDLLYEQRAHYGDDVETFVARRKLPQKPNLISSLLREVLEMAERCSKDAAGAERSPDPDRSYRTLQRSIKHLIEAAEEASEAIEERESVPVRHPFQKHIDEAKKKGGLGI